MGNKYFWVMFSNPIFYNKDAYVIRIPANYCHDLYTHVQNSRVKQLQNDVSSPNRSVRKALKY